jgi:hypothetical protein
MKTTTKTTTNLGRKRNQQRLLSDCFLFQSTTEQFNRRKQRRLPSDFFSSFLKTKLSRRKEQRELLLDIFFFSIKRATNDDDIMTMMLVSINNRDDLKISSATLTQSSLIEIVFFRTLRFEFCNR